MSAVRDRVRGEGGFTLVELIVAVAITGILISGLGTMFLATRKAEDTASERFSVNNDVATASAYFQEDVQSHQAFEENAGGGCLSSGTARLRMTWTDAFDDEAFEVSYVESPGRTDRILCHDEGSGWEEISSNLFVHDATISGVAVVGATGLRLELAAAGGESLALVAHKRSEG